MSIGVRFALAVVSIALLGTGCAGDPGAVDHDPHGRIVFARQQDEGESDLWLVDLDTGEERMLVQNAAHPAVSPDATRIAFVRDGDIWTSEASGLAPRQVTHSGDDSSPAWSHDGERIYFARFESAPDVGEGQSIFWVAASGGRPSRLTRGELGDEGVCHGSPAPSPDGLMVAYDVMSCRHGFDQFIDAAPVRGKTLPFSPLSMFQAFVWTSSPTWSADGGLFAFVAIDMEGDLGGLYVSSPEGAFPVRVSESGWEGAPAFSPDGRWIAFYDTDADDRKRVWVAETNGDGLREVTAGEADVSPAWLPPSQGVSG